MAGPFSRASKLDIAYHCLFESGDSCETDQEIGLGRRIGFSGMANALSPRAGGFSMRLCECPIDQLQAFAETEIMSGLPSIFVRDDDTVRFQEHVAAALGVSNAASEVLIVGSAKTGFRPGP